MSGKKYEPPLTLDMDFSEALQRFSLTRKQEVDDLIKGSSTHERRREGVSMPLKWSKTLSRTDAQQKTAGYPVPYLRFTKASNPQDNQTWFRNTFFAGTKWKKSFFGKHPVEEALVEFDVTIVGQKRGARTMMVTHDDTRQNNNNTPNTYLHYDDDTRSELEATNYTGRTVTVSRTNAGSYEFTIT